MPIRMTGMVSGLDTESLVQELVSAYSTKKDKYVKAQTKLSWKQEAWSSLNDKVKSFRSSLLGFRFSSGTTKTVSVSDTSKAKVTASGSAMNGVQSLQITKLAKTQSITGGKLSDTAGNKVTSSSKLSDLGYSGGDGTISLTIGSGSDAETTELNITSDTTISDVVSFLKEKGLNASFDEKNQRLFVSAKESGVANTFTLTQNEGSNVLDKLGINMSNANGDTARDEKKATVVNAQDAVIYLNGAEFTSSTNKFEINGLSITATGLTTTTGEYDGTEATAISLSTSVDTQGIYDKVKDFLTQYNEIINEMTSLYNADSSKGYEPLTEDEKSQMSDKEIEKWEEKIKTSLLRRDTTLSGIMNVMQTTMAGSYTTSSGKSYTFAALGVQTLGIMNSEKNQQNAYHIYGDADDSAVSGKTDSLMKAIEEDPDSIMEFFKNVATKLDSELGNKMSSTSLRSYNSIYNDKEMATEYSNYNKTIATWEQKVKDMEDSYYKKFSAMETALSKLQSQTSSLTGMLGG